MIDLGICFPVKLGLETWHFSYLPLRATDKLEYRRIRTTFENMNLPNLYTPRSANLKNFYYLGAKAWNNLPSDLRNKCDAKAFSNIYKAQLLHSIIGDPTYVVNNAYDFLYRPKI